MLRLLTLAVLFSALNAHAALSYTRTRHLTEPIISSAVDELSQPTMRTRVMQGVRIPMRDSVRLVADVILPEPEGRYPTILVRTPYGRQYEANWVRRGQYFVTRGYVVVVQSVRGREDSEGDWQPWMNERRDGYDTIDWISKQAWSDGKVGMIGGSYLGSVQLQAAAEAHPALKCIIPYIAGTDLFFQVPYDHGIFNLELLTWLYVSTNRARVLQEQLPPNANPESLKTLPLSRVDDAWAGVNLPVFDGWLTRDRPSAFAGGNFLSDLARVNNQLPILHLSGWWDGAAGGVKRNWEAMRAAGNRRQWLVYGFWTHGFSQWDGRGTRFADVDYGAASVFDFQTLYLRWFDTWLKSKPVGLERVPRVQVFMTGANEWRGFNDWAAPNSREMSLYLRTPEREGNTQSVGELNEARPTNERSPLRYSYDPARVSVSRDINFLGSTRLWFEPSDGDNLLFQTAPLTEAMDVAGQVELDLHFSTSAEDTDFFALLVDIDERGERRALNYPGKIRTRYLSGWELPQPLEPKRVYRATIQLRDIAHRFGRGHRIGLAIRSEWFPSFARNLNTSEPIAMATRIVVARQTIYGGAQRPSVLRFRVLPRQ